MCHAGISEKCLHAACSCLSIIALLQGRGESDGAEGEGVERVGGTASDAEDDPHKVAALEGTED